jgi:hypothetical protein
MTPSPFTIAAERAAARSLHPDPLAAFADCPAGTYCDVADAFEALLPTLSPTALHPVAVPRVVALLAERVPQVPEPVLLAFVREELLHEARERGTLADGRVKNRLIALTDVCFG